MHRRSKQVIDENETDWEAEHRKLRDKFRLCEVQVSALTNDLAESRAKLAAAEDKIVKIAINPAEYLPGFSAILEAAVQAELKRRADLAPEVVVTTPSPPTAAMVVAAVSAPTLLAPVAPSPTAIVPAGPVGQQGKMFGDLDYEPRPVNGHPVPVAPMAPSKPSGLVWSAMQEAIFKEVMEGSGNLAIEALAGASKTTVLCEAVRRILAKNPQARILVMAFNKEIQGELSKRMPPGVEVKTTHALGLAALKGAYRGSNLDAQKVQAILKQPEWFEPDARGYLTPAQSQKVTALRKLASFTKSTLGLTVEEMLVSLQKLKLSPFLLEPEMEERIREMPDHLQESVTKRAIANLHKALMALLDQCLKHIGYGYDFDDMVWAPIALGLKFEQFDWVLVDEAQDLTKVQIEMVSRCIKQTGRVCVVGDVLQAIYTFRGADAEAFRLLVSRLNAKVMPLSITYRCGKAIVEFVRSRVPGLALEAGPGNAPGEVRFEEQLDLSQLRHGDFVISRSNAPLLGNAIRALAFGHKAVILGKDLSADLTNEILRIQKGIRYSKEDKATVLDGLERDIKRQCEERAQRGEECEDLTDRIECFRALFLACPTLAAVFKMVASLCVDKETGLAGCLVFTNTHKVKGLEADRVFMLAPTFRPERGQEEMNLWYVAATRAKQTLTMVNSR